MLMTTWCRPFYGENKMTIVSNTERVLEALKSGELLTAKQITARFGVANPHAAISAIRLKGYAVYLNEYKTAKGDVTKKYRLGTPSREIVAAGMRALMDAGVRI